jgi:hypothetical protein
MRWASEMEVLLGLNIQVDSGGHRASKIPERSTQETLPQASAWRVGRGHGLAEPALWLG